MTQQRFIARHRLLQLERLEDRRMLAAFDLIQQVTGAKTFGKAVAGSTEQFFVGDPNTSAIRRESGLVARFNTDPAGDPLDPLFGAGAVDFERFGSALDADDEVVVVGMPGVGFVPKGEAYLFSIPQGTLLARIGNPTPVSGEEFGHDVAVGGDLVVVSDPSDQPDGVVYVFQRSRLEQGDHSVMSIQHPEPGTGRLGRSVDVIGDDILVSTDGNAAYRFDGRTGELEATFTNPNNFANNRFGSSIVAINDRWVGVGAPGATFTNDFGQVNIFDAVTGVHSFNLDREADPAPNRNDLFGHSLASDGQFVLVGAPARDIGGVTHAGQVSVYDANRLSAQSAQPIHTLNNPDSQPLEFFGQDVAFAGLDIVVSSLGSPGPRGETLTPGTAYQYVGPDRVAILGLDRWWATVGQESLDVDWILDVPRDGEYSIDIDIAGFNDWDLKFGAAVAVNGVEVDTFDILGLTGTAELGTLVRGRHTLTISSFDVPNQPVVEPVTFRLVESIDNTTKEVTSLESLFVADVAGVPKTRVFEVAGDGDDSKESLTVDALIDRFAPILFFSSEEQHTVPLDFQEVILGTARPKGLYHADYDAVRGNAEDSLNTSSLLLNPPNPADTTAAIYATVTDTDTHFHINYWFFYGASNWGQHGNGNTHELDVEGIGVTFIKDDGVLKPSEVVYAQHDVATELFGDFFAPSEILAWDYIERDGTRPHVYVGLGGHASYPFPGLTDVLTPRGRIKEAHDGHQHAFTANPEQVHVLPNISSPDAPEWLRYPGFLGDPDLANDGRTLSNSGDEAPRGPVFLRRVGSAANGSTFSAFGERYLEPLDVWVDPFSTFVPGNVTVVQKKGKVTIEGTEHADHFEIRQDDAAWVVSGLHGTKVNGTTSELIISSPPRRLEIKKLGDGDDAVTIRDLGLLEMLQIKTGDGDDLVRLIGVASVVETLVKTGKGTDLVELVDSCFGPTAKIATGQGDDEILTKNLLCNGATLDGGDGFDILRQDEIIPLVLIDFEDFRDLVWN